MGIAGFLRFYRLADTGQNLYYAAGVRSMLDSWHNFFFVAFDPGGALAIDKPPLGFWLQVASAKALGFHWWALALPQAVAGTAAAPVLYVIVRGRFGQTVAAIAALALALTPASVASARNNSLDTVTMLLMLVAAAAALRALHDDRFRWLAITAVACGLAFNSKMFAAFVPLPAFAVAYTVAHWGTLGVRRNALAGFGALLVAVSLIWVVVVGVTPASDRPVLYNGYGNSIWALTFRFNGVNRIVGTPPQSRVRSPVDTSEGQSAAATPPSRRPWRLFAGRLGGQIGWLLLAAIAGCVWLLRRPRRAPADILWATWFASALMVFTVSSDMKPQYLEAMAAPTAVCASLGLVALVDGARRRPIPAAIGAVVLCAYSSYLLLLSHETRWWAVVVITAALVSAATIAFYQALHRFDPARLAVVFAALALLVGPATWSAATALEPQTGSSTRYPVGGPGDLRIYPPPPGSDHPAPGDAQQDPALAFLEQNTATNKYLVLTERSLFGNAARYILVTNRPVLTLDEFETQSQAEESVSRLVASGALRYLELPPEGPWADPALAFGRWFTAKCRDITRAGLAPLGPAHLYDCGG